MTSKLHDKPLAAPPLKSYRYKGPFGFIMIGANTIAQALSEAESSLSNEKRASVMWLDVWDGEKYVPAVYAVPLRSENFICNSLEG